MSDMPEFEHLIATPTIEGLTCHMHFRGGWHRVGETPDYGVHAARILLAVQGEHGAVSAEINTGWHLSKTYEFWDGRSVGQERRTVQMTIDEIILHSRIPWDDDGPCRSGCFYLNEMCYWRGAFDVARRSEARRQLADVLVGEGMSATYSWLAQVYCDRLEKQYAEMTAYAGVSL